jgi:hypothetical protein
MLGLSLFRSEPHTQHRLSLPKMSFPMFDGTNPCIWKDKCQDCFHLYNIPESLWHTAASLHMEGHAAKWLQVHRRTKGLSN